MWWDAPSLPPPEHLGGKLTPTRKEGGREGDDLHFKSSALSGLNKEQFRPQTLKFKCNDVPHNSPPIVSYVCA